MGSCSCGLPPEPKAYEEKPFANIKDAFKPLTSKKKDPYSDYLMIFIIFLIGYLLLNRKC